MAGRLCLKGSAGKDETVQIVEEGKEERELVGKMIELAGITKTYRASGKEVEALKGVSLKVERGDIFGVIGYSGAGKSTLIRCINLLEHPDQGRVIINGEDITDQTEGQLEKTRQKTGMIFQHFNLLKSKTVYDNIALPLKYLKKGRREIDQKVDELLALVSLEEKRNSYPSQLSGGQKQRVAIARALANDPQILLSDEATSALDPQTTDSILELLRQLNQKLGLTIVIITHEMHVIKEICNKVAIMEKGGIVEQGGLFDVFTNPQSQAAKRFTAGLFKLDGLEKLLKQIDLRELTGEEGKLLHLVFLGERANDAYIARLVRNFQVDVSIIYGGIEVVQQQTIGSLFVIIRGSPSQITRAVDDLKSKGVAVSVLAEGAEGRSSG